MDRAVAKIVIAIAVFAAAPVTSHAATENDPNTTLASDDQNRVVCRRLSVTGSLVQAKKICKTNAEWRGQTQNAQNEADQMQQRGLINSCGATEPGKC